MSQAVLAPIIHRDSYTLAVEREILDWMRETVWMPLLIELHNAGVPVDPKYQAIKFDETGAAERVNAGNSAISEALNSGRIHYADGVFTGRFSSKITKELRAIGVVRDVKSGGFRLTGTMPDDIKAAVVNSLQQSRELHSQVTRTLATIETNLTTQGIGLGLNFSKAVDQIIVNAGRDFISSVATQGIAVPAEFTPAMRKQLTEQLTTNLDLHIQGWAKDRIPQLRKRVEENVFNGMRSDRLAKIIESEFGISKRKAAFLADQETGLLMAKYREARYQDVGVQEYIWQTAHDVRVRPDHAALNGQRFSFKNPPITNRATGDRNNPGTDWRCRCVPRPIVSFVPETAEK